MRAVGIGLVAAGVVGAGFGFAIALRANAVAHHPITAAFGTAAEVAVTPTESTLSVGHGRLMFRATLRQLGNHESSGRVVVFAPARDFTALMVGQPVRFRARITRPARHDLPGRCIGLRMRSARGSPLRLGKCCRQTRRRCCPGWSSGTHQWSAR
jgi:competence protein ComEC